MENHYFQREDYSNLKEIQDALTKPFPTEALKERKGKLYIPIHHIKQRMISVLGVDAYNVSFSEITHHAEDWITCDCTLTVDFTPWGGLIKSSTQSNGIQIARHKENEDKKGLIVDLGSAYKSLRSGALAKAAEDIGIGLYLKFENNSNNKGNNFYSNNGNSRPASKGQEKAARDMERKLGINEEKKIRLINRLFTNEANKALKKPTFSQMDKYIKTLKPVCDIYDIVTNTYGSRDEIERYVFNELGKMFNIKIQSYVTLLTLADNKTVAYVQDLFKATA